VNDFYVRFIRPEASEKAQVRAGRVATLVSMVLGCGLGLLLTDATQAFNLLLLIGAGTGGLFILRWFWWRINAWTEIVAMVGSLAVAGYFTFVHDALASDPVALVPALAGHEKLAWGALITTAIWVLGTWFTPAESEETLQRFVNRVRPGGPGWKRFAHDGSWTVPRGIVAMMLGSGAVYAALFAVGNALYGNLGLSMVLAAFAVASGWGIWKVGLK